MMFAAVGVLSFLAGVTVVNGDCMCEKAFPVCSSRDKHCYKTNLHHSNKSACPSGCTSGYQPQEHYVASVQDAINKAEQSLEQLQTNAFDIKAAAADSQGVPSLVQSLEAQLQQSNPNFQSLPPAEKRHALLREMHAKMKEYKANARNQGKAAKAAARFVKKAAKEASLEQRHSGQHERVYQETSQSGEYRSERFEDEAEDARDSVNNFVEELEKVLRHAIDKDTHPPSAPQVQMSASADIAAAGFSLAETGSIADDMKATSGISALMMLVGFVAGVSAVSAFSWYRHRNSGELAQTLLQ